MGMNGIPKSQASRLCVEIDDKVILSRMSVFFASGDSGAKRQAGRVLGRRPRLNPCIYYGNSSTV